MNILIQPAGPEHTDALTEIAVAAKRHWNYLDRWMQLWLPALTISAEYISANETWIAVFDGKPVAWYSLKQDEGDLWLDYLWVSPPHMGKGIGRDLFLHALERSRIRNASLLKIEVDPHAETFYIRMGARRVSEHCGEVDGQTRILPVMEIDL